MARDVFKQAAGFFVETAELIPDDSWEKPGLGVWTVRELVGHTRRALTNVETYADNPAERVELNDAAEYFLAVGGMPNISESIAERSREAGKELGDDPLKTVRETSDRVLKAIEAMPDSLILPTFAGGMSFNDYLETRILELTVHTVDIASAIGKAVEPPTAAISTTLRVLSGVAARSGKGAEIALAITGRRPLPQSFNLLV